mgnify:FL=1
MPTQTVAEQARYKIASTGIINRGVPRKIDPMVPSANQTKATGGTTDPSAAGATRGMKRLNVVQ